MRRMLVAAALIAVVAGIAPPPRREAVHPVPRTRYPPAPTAAEESGVWDTESPRASPPRARPTPPIQAPDSQKTERTPPRSHPPRQQVPAAREEPQPVPAPGAQAGRDTARSMGLERQPRDPDEGAQTSSPGQMAPVGESATGSQPSRADIAARVPVLTPPVLLTPSPQYPAAGYAVVLDRAVLTPRLRIEAAQGRVVLRVRVRSDGSVAEIAISESSGVPALDQAAVRAAAGWTFTPATRDGQPIGAWVLIPMRFIVP